MEDGVVDSRFHFGRYPGVDMQGRVHGIRRVWAYVPVRVILKSHAMECIWRRHLLRFILCPRNRWAKPSPFRDVLSSARQNKLNPAPRGAVGFDLTPPPESQQRSVMQKSGHNGDLSDASKDTQFRLTCRP